MFVKSFIGLILLISIKWIGLPAREPFITLDIFASYESMSILRFKIELFEKTIKPRRFIKNRHKKFE